VHQEDEDVPRRLSAHPAEVELLALAIGRDVDAPEEARGHVAHCPTCARREAELKDLAGAIELESILQEEIEAAAPHPASPWAAERRERLARLSEGADAALLEAEALLERARDAQADLAGSVRDLATRTGGRLALLYAAQRGAFAAAVPQRALALAEAIEAVANGLEPPAEAGARAVPPALLRAEALLLASQALLNIGRLREARAAAVAARTDFAMLGDDPFSGALCDYFEASVLCFEGAFGPAERLFKRAARVFADFAQDHWVGRAESMLAQMLVQRGNPARALASFDAAVERLDPDRDANAFAVTLLNRARCLALRGRFEAAQQGFAQALRVARRHRLDALVFGVRQGLADLEFLRGDYDRALAGFGMVAAEADRLGLEEDKVVTRLGAAECLGRLGRTDEMMSALREIGRLVAVTDLAGNPAWTELAARLDPGDVDLGLVSEVREHLAAARDGFVLPFRAARRA
jgi:tetratricopeptide (TPR) repeat protein